MTSDLVIEIYKQPQTVFTTKDVSMLFPKLSPSSLKNKLHYAVKTGKLLSPRKGIYTKENFNKYELANKIFTPSYISLETVLQKTGIIFQQYESIFLVSYLTRTIETAKQTIQFRKIKDPILFNPQGLNNKETYIIASPERAFLDAVFLYKNYHFDNLNTLNWEKVMKIAQIYQTKSFSKRVKEYYELFKKSK